MEVLIYVLIFWAVVTVLGHSTWVVVAYLFRTRNPEPTRGPKLAGDAAPVNRSACPRCQTTLDAVTHHCDVCGWPSAVGSHADPQAALRALRQQLGRLTELEALDAESYSGLRAAIVAHERRLAELKGSGAAGPASASADSKIFGKEPLSEPVAPGTNEPVPVAESLPSTPPPIPIKPAPPAERVRKFSASRAAAAAAPLSDPAIPKPKPREALSRLFAAFMEEKNIRWGELVGGLLIVGCSVALVISFWAEIAARPLLKFVLFNGVTAALFGVGLYTDRRWKIHTTSHGLLVIAMLLVPLNFLAIAAFTQGAAANDLVTLAGEAVSAGVFSLLVYLAARILTPSTAGWFAAGVMLPSLMQLLIRRFAGPSSTSAELYTLAAVPLAGYVISSALVVERNEREGLLPSQNDGDLADALAAHWTETEALRLLTFLGVVSAATFFPLALLTWKVPPVIDTIHRLSPLAVWYGVPALVVGLMFWQRRNTSDLGRASAESPLVAAAGGSLALDNNRVSVGVQTAGLAIGVLGAAIVAGAVVAAWPEPATLLPVAVMNVIAFATVAFWFGIPAALLPAGLALAGAWLVAFHLVRGNVGWHLAEYLPLTRALVSVSSGHALVPLVGLFGAGSWVLSRAGRRDDSHMVSLVAAATAVVSLGLVLWFGFGRPGDPAGATWTLAIYALATLAAAWRVDKPLLAGGGAALLLLALVQAVVFRLHDAVDLDRPRVVALLTHATLMVAGYVVTRQRPRRHAQLSTVLGWWAAVSSGAAAGLLAALSLQTSATVMAICLVWLAAVWLALAVLSGWVALFTASQVVVLLAIFSGVTAAVENHAWYADAQYPWLDPWFLATQGVAKAIYCLVCGAVRWIFVHDDTQRSAYAVDMPAPKWFVAGHRLLNPPWPAVDHIVETALVVLLILVALYAAAPGTMQELAPLEAARGLGAAERVVMPIEQFEFAGISHAHAATPRAWLLGGSVIAVLAAGLWRQYRIPFRLAGIVIAVAMLCPLLAAQWEADVAVASAWRWFSAALFALASVPVWLRDRWDVLTWLRPGGRRDPGGAKDAYPNLGHLVRDWLVTLSLLVYVAMGTYVGAAALARAGLSPAADRLWPLLVVWAVIALNAAAIAPRIYFRRTHQPENRAVGSLPTWARPARDVLLLLALAPLIILFAFAVAAALDQHPIVGPELGSWFRTIGWDVSYGVPLSAIALTLVGYAIRDRSSGFAFAAGLLANVVATIVILMRLARGGGGLDAAGWMNVAQVNAIMAGGVALVWLLAMEWHRSSAARHGDTETGRQGDVAASAFSTDSPPPVLLVTQVALAAAFCATFLVPAAVAVAIEPDGPAAWAAVAGHSLGWIALTLSAITAVWIYWQRPVPQALIAGGSAAVVAITAVTALQRDNGNWLAFHVLIFGTCAAAWLVPLITQIVNGRIRDSEHAAPPVAWSAVSARVFGIFGVLLAVIALVERDPDGPWWTIAALVAISARNVWIAWREGGHEPMWVAAALANVAVSIWWIDQGQKLTATRGRGELPEFIWINAIAAAAMAVVSVWVERFGTGQWPVPLGRSGSQNIGSDRVTEPVAPADVRWRRLSYHRFAAWTIAILLLLLTAGRLLGDFEGNVIRASAALGWIAWCAAVVAAVACWWDIRSRWPVACLYTVGLVSVGMYLDGLDFRPPMFFWALAMALAAYALATSYLWSRREGLRKALARWGVPNAVSITEQQFPSAHVYAGHGGLIVANGLLAAAVLLLVTWIEITMPEFRHRMIAAYAIGAVAVALGLLTRGAVRSPLQYTALVFGALFAVAFGWAWLPPTFSAPWLHRIVAATAALAVVIVLYGLGLVKLLRRENEWTRAAGRLVPSLAVIAAALLFVVLGIEVAAYAADGEVPIAWPALVAVAAALAGLAAAALAAALLPGRDPLGLSERGRTLYVYAAEVLAALVFLHIRVTMPWLFRGWFLRFWPLVVMAIAFVGVGLGEYFRRRRQQLLSEPLENTGALLPVLPALGFWVTGSEVHYSLVLLTVGVLYAAVSVLRKSFLFAVLAAVAANGSLWYLLYEHGRLGIAEHPQLWLIPPALCVLVAGYLNRERLSAEQSAALRYGAAMVIYVSSTADIFINGVADAPWLPAVLAGLSILGVFAGILLRMQSLLVMGTLFLLVAVMTVIWYAAVEQQRTWILWLAGIITGVLIIALFGLFEKRRDDVLRVVDRLRQWEA